jgi:hypothetical protein
MSLLNADRRAHDRFTARFPLKVDAGARKNRLGVAYDASAGGLLFNTRTRFRAGTDVQISIIPLSEPPACSGESPPSLETIHVRARVVRVEAAPPTSRLPWRWLTAVQFERELPHLVASMRAATVRPPPLPIH